MSLNKLHDFIQVINIKRRLSTMDENSSKPL
jgi:hypothetical protein